MLVKDINTYTSYIEIMALQLRKITYVALYQQLLGQQPFSSSLSLVVFSSSLSLLVFLF